MSPRSAFADRAGSAGIDWALTWRQLVGTLRLDLRRSLFSPRALAALFLAFAPAVLVGIWTMTPFPGREFAGPNEAVVMFSVLFELYVRVSIFFSALFLFVSLYRSDILEKSLHYYLLTPVRREVVALGKYLAALIVSFGIFALGTATLFLLITSPWGLREQSNYLVQGPGLANLLGYLGVVGLACAGYGALFLLIGVVFRNPVLPAAALWVWEAANLLLPPMLKRFSVIFYLHSLYPIPLAKGLFEMVADPAPVWLSLTGAVFFVGAVLFLAGWRVRRMDLAYGGE